MNTSTPTHKMHYKGALPLTVDQHKELAGELSRLRNRLMAEILFENQCKCRYRPASRQYKALDKACKALDSLRFALEDEVACIVPDDAVGIYWGDTRDD